MANKNPSMFICMVLLTSIFAAENKVLMSVGEPQNCMDPFPNRRKELFLLTDMDGLMDNLVDPCKVTDAIKSMDETTASE